MRSPLASFPGPRPAFQLFAVRNHSGFETTCSYVPKMQVIFVRATLLLWLWGPSCNANNPKPAPRYAINLDLPAEERWNEVVSDFEDDIRAFAASIPSLIPWSEVDEIILNILGNDIDKHLSYPYGEEMAGIAKAAGVPRANITMMNFMYELYAYNHSNPNSPHWDAPLFLRSQRLGPCYLARNTDGDSGLRNVTIIVDFMKNGETVYTGTTFAGCVGFLFIF